MTREQARQEIRSSWRQIIPTITGEARRKVNGEASYICPLCGHGTHGDGLTRNPQSKDGNGLKCFSCGFGGDIIDLYQQATGKDHSTALIDLAAIAGVEIDGNRQAEATEPQNSQIKRPQRNFNGQGDIDAPADGETQQRPGKCPTAGAADFTEYYTACNAYLTGPEGEAGRDYLNRRGVLTAALYHGAGFDPQADPANAPGATGDTSRPHPCPRIIIPCSSGHYVARSIDPKTPKDYAKLNPARSKGAGAPAIFNEKALLAQEVQEIFITEGAFDALSVIEMGGQAIAINSVSNARALIEKLEKAPTKAALILCLDNDGPGKKAAQEVQEGLQRLQIPFISADITGGHKDPNEALCADREAFYDAVQDAIAEARAYKNKLQEEARKAEEERQQRTGAGMIDAFLEIVRTRKYEPVPTGITDIDNAIGGGFLRQQLILLGAAPGAGKTSFAQWIFEGMAERGQSVIYVNLEMSREQMLARSISRIAARNGDNIRATEILQGYKWDWTTEAAITGAAEEYKAKIAPRMLYNPPEITADLDGILSYLEAEAQRAEAAGVPVPCIVLDYLQIIRGRDREDDTAVIKRAMGSLKGFAIKHNTFVFIIMANNRASNRTGDVTMESGRDSSSLEYGADIQLGLAFTRCLNRAGFDRKSKDELTPEELKFITLKITKGRWGGPGKDVDLYFDGETMTFSQLARDYEEEEAAAQQPRKAGRKAGKG